MIRLADPGDAERLAEIARRAYAPYTAEIGRLPAPAMQDFPAAIAARRVWVQGRPPQGYVVAFRTSDAWFLENVAVAPEGQGQGLGRALIAFAEAEGQKRGLRRVTLYTNVKMTGNLALYPALGYRETDRRREDGFDRVYFEKRL